MYVACRIVGVFIMRRRANTVKDKRMQTGVMNINELPSR